MAGRRIYTHEDGGSVIITKEEFLAIPLDEQKKYTLVDRIPSVSEIKEYDDFNRMRRLVQKIVNMLEETSDRPPVFTKKGTPVRWRYSSHDISNIVAWTASAFTDRINTLEAELRSMKEDANEVR